MKAFIQGPNLLIGWAFGPLTYVQALRHEIKSEGAKIQTSDLSELKTELGVLGAHEKFSIEKASRLA